jgi:hypothetical protein
MIVKYLNLLMVVIYLSAGLIILFDLVHFNLTENNRLIIGILLIVYGIFRGVRVFLNQSNKNQ